MINIKQLSQNQQIFFPQTSAEAVLVKENSGKVITLDTILKEKISPNESPQPLLIQHDARGMIVQTEPVKSMIITVNGIQYKKYDSSQEQNVNFGDDFKINDNKIQLNWVEDGNT